MRISTALQKRDELRQITRRRTIKFQAQVQHGMKGSSMKFVGFTGNRFVCMYSELEQESIVYKIEGCRESMAIRKLFKLTKREVKTFACYKGYMYY